MRRFTTFYSWQSTLPNETNRSFIEKAIQRALVELPGSNPGLLPILDRDVVGVPGTPEIVGTILSKIDQSDAVIADVSFVGTTADGRPLPNPNVMFELGHAQKSLGWGRLLLVFNEGTGNVTDLPFDLGGTRRHPITYRLEQSASTEDRAVAKRSLVSTLKEALAMISQSALSSGLTPAGPVHVDETSFLGLSCHVPRFGPPSAAVSAFQARVVNTSSAPINSISGFVQANRSSTRIPITLTQDGKDFDPSRLRILPIGESVAFYASFEGSGSGLDSERFLQELTPFSLFLTVEGQETRLEYGTARCSGIISEAIAHAQGVGYRGGPCEFDER